MRQALEPEQVLREYAAIQERLCESLFDQYPIDSRFLTDLPKRGILSLRDGLWTFQRHGTGVCFTCVRTKEMVDAHSEPVTYPAGIDAWRLLLYLESRGIETLNHGLKAIDATEQESLQDMLQQLCREGLLVVADPERRIYSLCAVGRPSH